MQDNIPTSTIAHRDAYAALYCAAVCFYEVNGDPQSAAAAIERAWQDRTARTAASLYGRSS